MNAYLHLAMFGDDDKYMSLPDWVRRNNLLIGKGKYAKWAMPQEMRFAYGIGDAIAEAAFKRKTRGQIAGDMLESVSELLPANIFGDGAGILHAIAPSSTVPLIEALSNTNFYGGPLYKDNPNNKNLPGFKKVYANTGKMYVDAARWLNNNTGGNDYKKSPFHIRGWHPFDINPAIVEHLVSGYLGGLGTTFWQGAETIESLFNKEEPTYIKNVPGLNRLMLNDEDYLRDSYVEEMYQHFWWDHGKLVGDRMKLYEKDGMDDEIRKESETLDYKYYELYEQFDKEIKEAGKEGDTARQLELKKMYIEMCLKAYYGIEDKENAKEDEASGKD
jgi:hypothetical protein